MALGAGAEISPVEPDQGHTCEGRQSCQRTSAAGIHWGEIQSKNLFMKKMGIAAMLLLWTVGAVAQHSISGKILHGQQALEGATIVIQGPLQTSTLSLADGSFFVGNLPAGEYSISSSFSGFQTQRQRVTLPVKAKLLIELTELKTSLQPVEIKALRAGENAPFAQSNLSKAVIEKNNLGQDIPFLLNQTPNVVINSDAGNGVGYTGIRIRGSDATRINMTINGIPYNDAESQITYFVDLPDFLSSVSSVQIQRGVGASSNGPGAFGASMNFSTHEYNEEAYAQSNNSFGSFNTLKNTIKLGSGLIDKKFTIDARLSRLSSDGYIDRASSNLLGAYFNAAYWGKKSSLKLNVLLGKEKTYQAWNGISADDLKNRRTYNSLGTDKPGDPYANQTDNFWQNHYQLFWTKTFNSFWSFNTAAYLTTGKGYYEEYKGTQDLADYGLASEETDLIRRLWLKNKLFGQIFSAQYEQGKTALTVGGGWSHYPARHFGNIIWAETQPSLQHQWYRLRAHKTDANLYTKYQYKLGKDWNVFADLQGRYAQYKIDGFRKSPDVKVNKDWFFVNPKAGISYSSANWSGFASYALGHKEPNRDDFEAGVNQLPKPEQLHDFEANISRKNIVPGWSLSLTGYYMLYKDQLVLTGKINDVGAYTRTNIPRSYRAGIELESRYDYKWMSIRYNGSFSRNKVKNFTEYIDQYDVDWNWTGQTSVQYGSATIGYSPSTVQYGSASVRPVKNAELEWANKYVGSQYLDNTGNPNRMLDGFFTSDIRGSYSFHFRNWLKEIKITLQANNVFNKLYQPNGYSFSYYYTTDLITENFYYPMAGTNYMAALNIRF